MQYFSVVQKVPEKNSVRFLSFNASLEETLALKKRLSKAGLADLIIVRRKQLNDENKQEIGFPSLNLGTFVLINDE